MCSSTQSTFAWLGFLLINAGFISLTAYGAVKLWPLGFCVCGLYTTLLFWLAGRAARCDTPLVQNDAEYSRATSESSVHPEASEGVARLTEEREGHPNIYPIFANLLYALGVIGLAVTGLFLPLNVLPCAPRSNSDAKMPSWTTNFTQLPEHVRPWARDDTSYPHNKNINLAAKKTWTHIQNTTLFLGTTDMESGSSPTLWAIRSNDPSDLPQEYAQYNPDCFVDVGTAAVCFVEQSKVPVGLVCSRDGETFHYPPADSSTSKKQVVEGYVRNFFIWNELLWFKESPNFDGGFKIYSLNVMDMNLTCYSKLDPSSSGDNDDDEKCSQEQTNRQLGLGILLASGLPMLAVSAVLWQKKQVPSMGFTSFLAATVCYCTIFAAVRPNNDDPMGHPLNYWLAIAGFLVMVVLSYAVLVVVENGSVLAWGLNTAGLSFMIGMNFLLLEQENVFWHWLVLNLLCFFPLIFLGAVTGSVFLLFLGAFGFLMDAWRFAMYLQDQIHSDESFLVVFLTLACSGCAITAAGLFLNRYQDSLRAETVARLRSIQSWFGVHDGVSYREIDESLLLAEHELNASSPCLEADDNNFVSS